MLYVIIFAENKFKMSLDYTHVSQLKLSKKWKIKSLNVVGYSTSNFQVS